MKEVAESTLEYLDTTLAEEDAESSILLARLKIAEIQLSILDLEIEKAFMLD